MSLQTQAERLALDIAGARAVLAALDESAIYDLLRRAQFSTRPDGYAASTRPVEIHGGGDDDPLLAAVIARIEPGHETDPLKDNLDEIFGTLAEICGHARRIERLRSVVVNAASTVKDPQPLGGTCQCCLRHVPNTPNDRLRSGYCDACRTAWNRAGRPDRRLWEVDRRREADEMAQIQRLQDASELPTARAK